MPAEGGPMTGWLDTTIGFVCSVAFASVFVAAMLVLFDHWRHP